MIDSQGQRKKKGRNITITALVLMVATALGGFFVFPQEASSQEAKPDYVVTNLKIGRNPRSGEPVSAFVDDAPLQSDTALIKFTVKNQGTAKSDKFWAYRVTGIPMYVDPSLQTPLGVGESKELIFSLGKFSAGSHTVGVIVDDSTHGPYTQTPELDETNNSLEITFVVADSSTSNLKPDLTITNIAIDPIPTTGVPYTGTVTVTVQNQGTAATNASEGIRVSQRINLPDGSLVSLGSNLSSGLQYIPNLIASQWNTVNFSFSNVVFNSSSITISVDVDNAESNGPGVVSELNEQNNTFWKSFSLGSSKPAVTILTPQNGIVWQAGKVYSIQWVVDTTKILTTDKTTITLIKGSTVMSNLKHYNDSYSATNNFLEWTIPANTAPGYDYKIRVEVCRLIATDACLSQGFDESDVFGISAANTPEYVNDLSVFSGFRFERKGANLIVAWDTGKQYCELVYQKYSDQVTNVIEPVYEKRFIVVGNVSRSDLPGSLPGPRYLYRTEISGLELGRTYYYRAFCRENTSSTTVYQSAVYDYTMPKDVVIPEPKRPPQDTPSPNESKEIQALRERIQKLEYRISELEQQIVEREKELTKKIDERLVDRVKGNILLQVNEKGEAWYVDPATKQRFYLKDGNTAYNALRAFGIGITNKDLSKIPVGIENRAKAADTDGDGLPDKLEEAIGTNPFDSDSDDDGFSDGKELKDGFNPNGPGKLPLAKTKDVHEGKIFLQVESHGEAWYIHDGERFYLGNGDLAYQIMRFLSLGITNDDIRKIPVGEF